MTDPAEVPRELRDLAADFAGSLTQRIRRIVPTTVELSALALATGDEGSVSVGYLVDQQVQTIPLTIDEVHRLDLLLKLHCTWDRSRDFLAIEESWFHVFAKGKDRTPLFRFEYLRNPTRDVPCAHLQIHAHRDEVTYLMVKSETGRPAQRDQTDRVPRFAEIHFPLGGHRFRPCLEDLLHMLVTEFGIDRHQEWRTAVQEGREEWRRLQLKAAVRDAPEDARQALTLMGYTVTPPATGPVADKTERLRVY